MRRSLILTYGIFTAVFCGILSAQQGRIDGPTTGLAFDPASRSVREILGVPGAAVLSRALVEADNGSASPNGRYLLLISGGEMFGMDRASGRRNRLSGEARLMNWNASSTAAAFEFEGRLYVWQAGEESAELIGDSPDAVDSIALDAEGKTVFAAAMGGVYRIRKDESARLLASAGDAASLHLAMNGRSLVFVDRASRQAFEIADLENGSVSRIGLDAANPAGVALSRDSRLLFVGDNESHSLLLYDRASQTLRSRIEVGFELTRLERIGLEDVFALNTRSGRDALQVLSLSPEPNVYFIPAPVED